MRGEQLQLEMRKFITQSAMQILDKMLLIQAQENVVVLDEEQLLFIADGQDSTFDDDVDEPPVQDLALNMDQVFQADQCDAFDSDVDEALTVQTMFMVNVSSADLIYDEAGPSYDSDILSEGIHTALIKEVKEIKEIYEQMKAEVDQYAVDKKCAEIERKNLLIENENLLVDCFSNELFYSVMNVVNTVSIFSELHDAYTVKQARVVKLKGEISKLKHKIQKDDDSEMIKHFSNLEVKMDDPNITMEEYIRLEEEKARRHGKVYNWETANYGKIWYDEDVHDLRSVETKFPAIVFNDELSS
nr:retrovirus-related Pol polyprotein from transposon TNT 1-94 [Tanacetum cinerariifolium]